MSLHILAYIVYLNQKLKLKRLIYVEPNEQFHIIGATVSIIKLTNLLAITDHYSQRLRLF